MPAPTARRTCDLTLRVDVGIDPYGKSMTGKFVGDAFRVPTEKRYAGYAERDFRRKWDLHPRVDVGIDPYRKREQYLWEITALRSR